MPEYHALGGSDNRSCLSPSSRCWKSAVKVSAGLVSPEGCEGGFCFQEKGELEQDIE